MSISVIIPAYNEEKTVGSIISVVKQLSIIDRIIVVSDGSTDNTAIEAKNAGAHVIELSNNIGKGGAMKVGLNECDSEIVLFLDADLIGLKKEHIIDLLNPVLGDRADMSIGIFSNGRFVTDLAQKIAPFLSGQRAVKRNVFEKIKDLDISRYGVEVALTKHIEMDNIRAELVELKDMSHITKEEKLGLTKGFIARMKMYRDILKYLSSVKIK